MIKRAYNHCRMVVLQVLRMLGRLCGWIKYKLWPDDDPYVSAILKAVTDNPLPARNYSGPIKNPLRPYAIPHFFSDPNAKTDPADIVLLIDPKGRIASREFSQYPRVTRIVALDADGTKALELMPLDNKTHNQEKTANVT